MYVQEYAASRLSTNMTLTNELKQAARIGVLSNVMIELQNGKCHIDAVDEVFLIVYSMIYY